jgi:hypothetical protein
MIAAAVLAAGLVLLVVVVTCRGSKHNDDAGLSLIVDDPTPDEEEVDEPAPDPEGAVILGRRPIHEDCFNAYADRERHLVCSDCVPVLGVREAV